MEALVDTENETIWAGQKAIGLLENAMEAIRNLREKFASSDLFGVEKDGSFQQYWTDISDLGRSRYLSKY